MISFYWPWMLLGLLALPFIGWAMVRNSRGPGVKFSSLSLARCCKSSWRARLRGSLLALRLACIALLIVAMARPRKGTVIAEVSREGIAIMAVVDRSGSMTAEMAYGGRRLTRLEVVKEVLASFIKGDNKRFAGRSGDLIGLVTFARYADTVCPLVHTHDALLEFLRQTKNVSIRSEDGTAIGDAIALAAARLKKAEEQIRTTRAKLGLAASGESQDFHIKSKVILLLTDGRNNAGQYHPLAAADLAARWGIKVCAIGIGSGQAFTVINTLAGSMRIPVEQDLDEDLLKAIAQRTGGFYARADDAQALIDIVNRINELNKTSVSSQVMQYAEVFYYFAWPALAILLLEVLLGCTVLRKVP